MHIVTLYLQQTSAFQIYFRMICLFSDDPFPVGDITQCKSTVIRDVHVVELVFVAGGVVLVVLPCFFIIVVCRQLEYRPVA
jgi:hypothetical protein